MTTTRALAVAAYLAAVAAPASADWRAVADALHAALPAVRGAAAKPAEAPGILSQWVPPWPPPPFAPVRISSSPRLSSAPRMMMMAEIWKKTRALMIDVRPA